MQLFDCSNFAPVRVLWFCIGVSLGSGGCNDGSPEEPAQPLSNIGSGANTSFQKRASNGPSVDTLADGTRQPGTSAAPSNSTTPLLGKSARLPPNDVPRVYAKTRNVWIRETPTSDTQWIGFLWWGDSVPLKDTKPVNGPGCNAWYAVEPRGYVCVDGKRATLDPADPLLRGIYPYAHNPELPDPHPHYGETVGTYRYLHLPSEKSQRAKEWDFRFRQEWIKNALAGNPRHEQLLGVDLTQATATELVLPELPGTLQMAQRELIPRSTVAWSEEVNHGGRTFLLTDDLSWVPKDRVVPYPPVEYEGLHLGPDVRLPLAMFRKKDAVVYHRVDKAFGAPSGAPDLSPTKDVFPRLSWIGLTGNTLATSKATYHETTTGQWIDAAEAVIPVPRDTTPWGAKTFGKDSVEGPKGRRTWLHVSVHGGWMMAYEGTQPVFVTLMSPGRGGVPARGRPALETSATPVGWFNITGKFVTSTMIAPNDLTHSAVPWAQNFSGPHAIHGAYWHNAWGELKSGGCVNLSPKDAHWLFGFTEPKVPPGWHGVRWLPNKEGSTALLITP
jgi:hypothetical protein